MQWFLRFVFRGNVLSSVSTISFPHTMWYAKGNVGSYKVGQMDMAVRIQQHVIRLQIPMDDALLVTIL